MRGTCPNCGSKIESHDSENTPFGVRFFFKCGNCGREFSDYMEIVPIVAGAGWAH